MTRCGWACTDHQPMVAYHDEQWGVPQHGDQALFEFLCLEGAQAGLSWRTILDKRERFRERFHDFDIDRVAAMTDAELEQCMTDTGIVRNRRKVETFRNNARHAQEVIAEHGSLDGWLWSFVDGAPVVNHWREDADVPSTSPAAQAMSKALYKLGFRFVGATICYAFMQATGMVNDHLVDCPRHEPCRRLAE